MDPAKPARQRGRPPAFDHDAALEKAMLAFWAHGYEGTSMAELTEAMGINKPSLYGAFGSKEELFRKAVRKYLAGPAAFVEGSLQEPTARKVVEKLLTGAADFLADASHPRGCMVIQGALSCGQGAAIIREALAARRKAYEEALCRRFELARLQHDLPQDANPAALARLVATVHQGMSVQATGGASRAELLEVAQIVLDRWPAGS